MKLIVEVKDEKAPLLLEMLRKFGSVKTTPLTAYKAAIYEGVTKAVNEINLIKQGKLKGIPAKDLLDEL